VVAIIGPSGSGKSTLLRCINLLEEPDRRCIRVGEREMRFGGAKRTKPADRELSALSRGYRHGILAFQFVPRT
jgi:L-cystine transport system ATP-binding protein